MCSAEYALWFVYRSNPKWFHNLAISQVIIETMASLGMQFPELTVNIDEIKKEYHAIVDQKEDRGEHASESCKKHGKKHKKEKRNKH